MEWPFVLSEDFGDRGTSTCCLASSSGGSRMHLFLSVSFLPNIYMILTILSTMLLSLVPINVSCLPTLLFSCGQVHLCSIRALLHL